MPMTTDRDAALIRAYRENPDLTLDQIASFFDITKQRVDQILRVHNIPRHDRSAAPTFCKVCTEEYEKGHYLEHLKEKGHKKFYGDPKISDETLKLLYEHGIGTPTIAKHFGMSSTTAITNRLQRMGIRTRPRGTDSIMSIHLSPFERTEFMKNYIENVLRENGLLND